jgi:hypothetical protein
MNNQQEHDVLQYLLDTAAKNDLDIEYIEDIRVSYFRSQPTTDDQTCERVDTFITRYQGLGGPEYTMHQYKLSSGNEVMVPTTTLEIEQPDHLNTTSAPFIVARLVYGAAIDQIKIETHAAPNLQTLLIKLFNEQAYDCDDRTTIHEFLNNNGDGCDYFTIAEYSGGKCNQVFPPTI